jgi:hypothetical protein
MQDVFGPTPSAGDNSTKLATTAYVDTAVEVEDLWDVTTGVLENKAGPTSFVFNDATRDRISATATETQITAGDGKGYVKLTDNGVFKFFDGTTSRIYSTNISIDVVSPNGQTGLSIENAGIAITRDGWESINILSNGTTFLSPDNNKQIYLSNTGVSIEGDTGITGNLDVVGDSTLTGTLTAKYGATTRLWISDTRVQLIAPNGLTNITMFDASVSIQDAVRDRITMSSSESKLHSPDGATTLGVSDAQVLVTGALATTGDVTIVGEVRVCTGVDAKRLIIAPFNDTTAGGGIVLEGAGIYGLWNIDSFYNDFRVYGASADTVGIVFQNVGAGDLQFKVYGGAYIFGKDGFDEIGDTAIVQFGPTDSQSITAHFENVMQFKTHMGIHFSDVSATDYFKLDSGRVFMNNLPTINPTSAGELWNDNGTMKISAG